jgi:hypothetical protein
VLAVLLLATTLAPIDIIRDAVEQSQKVDHLRRNFSMTQKTISRSGNKVNVKVHEMTYRDGKPYRQLVSKDGEPVESKPESYNPNEERRRELFAEMIKAFDYFHAGEEQVDGVDCWILRLEPRPGYDPPSIKSSFLKHMAGTVWIAKKYSRLVKLDAHTTGPVTFGWFLAKLSPGTRIYLEQTRVEDEVWLPKRFKMTYDGRFLFKTIKGEVEQLSSNFRRISPGT